MVRPVIMHNWSKFSTFRRYVKSPNEGSPNEESPTVKVRKYNKLGCKKSDHKKSELIILIFVNFCKSGKLPGTVIRSKVGHVIRSGVFSPKIPFTEISKLGCF